MRDRIKTWLSTLYKNHADHISASSSTSSLASSATDRIVDLVTMLRSARILPQVKQAVKQTTPTVAACSFSTSEKKEVVKDIFNGYIYYLIDNVDYNVINEFNA